MKSTYEELAAENAALKSVITDIHSELYGHGFAVAGWHLNGALKPLDSWFEENDWEPETPATDAFLAEVRAQGVDVAIEHLINKFEGTGRIGVPVMALEWLALEIRKGAQS
ncbi:hypothetical protein ACEV6Q_12685 [Enterobacter ludwigii]|uniref:hypothetical protein n=1 Tax=Enterobacter ludwigii TaxID=299767 RepID=UPI003BEEFBDF